MLRTRYRLLCALASLGLACPIAGSAAAADAGKAAAPNASGTYPGLKYRMPEIMLITCTEWPKSADDQDILARFIKAHGFDAVETTMESLDALRRNGMYARLGTELAAAPKLKDDPAVFCYFICDRRKSDAFPSWAQIVRQYEAADPNHPTMFNNRALWNQFPGFVDRVHPNLLTYYHYQFRPQQHPERNLLYLGMFRELALKNHIPLLRCTDAKWPDARVRQEHFTSLAYGVQGFHYSPCYHFGFKKDAKGPILENGHIVPEVNSLFRVLMDVAKEIRTLSPVLIKLKSVDVFHAEPLPLGGKRPAADSWIDISGEQTLVGVFQDDAGGKYLMPVNYDPNKAREATLHFKTAIASVERMDKNTGKWLSLELGKDGAATTVKVPLAAGDGQLLKVNAP